MPPFFLIRSLLAGVALGALVTISHAAPTKRELATKIIQAEQAGMDLLARKLTGQLMQPRLQMLNQAIAQMPPDKREALAKDLQSEIQKSAPGVERVLRNNLTKLAPAILTPGLEERFTEEELTQILAWLQSPAMRKYQQFSLDIQGQLVQKLMTESRASAEPLLQSLDKALKTRLISAGFSASSSPSSAK